MTGPDYAYLTVDGVVWSPPISAADVFTGLDRPARLEVEIPGDGGSGAPPLPAGAPLDFWVGGYHVFQGHLERREMSLGESSRCSRLVAYAPFEIRRRRSSPACYYQVTDAEVAARVARELGLRPRVDATGYVHRRLERRGDPLRFLRRRALARGFELAVSGDVLYFVQQLPAGETARRVLWLRRVMQLDLVLGAGDERRGELHLAGDSSWRPLVDFELRGAGGPWDRMYYVRRCRHHLDGSGFRTVLEFAERRWET